MSTTSQKQKAGHYEILGETLAKFEFFEAGWNPYERYLDVDKVDLILRRRVNERIEYREIQVKYGKLYDCGPVWQRKLFDVTSWRFFQREEFTPFYHRRDFFIAYVLAHESGYKGDIFILPPRAFGDLIHQAISTGDKKKVYFSRSIDDTQRWYLRKTTGFEAITSDSCIEVTMFRRAFHLLG